jgi:hypothetical protein
MFFLLERQGSLYFEVDAMLTSDEFLSLPLTVNNKYRWFCEFQKAFAGNVKNIVRCR